MLWQERGAEADQLSSRGRFLDELYEPPAFRIARRDEASLAADAAAAASAAVSPTRDSSVQGNNDRMQGSLVVPPFI